MSTLCIHKDIKEIVKRTVLWAVLLFFSSHAYSSAHICASDTLIIDGVTIGVEIEEVPEDSVLVEAPDTIPMVKPVKERNFNLGLSYAFGLGRAELVKGTTPEPVDLFIGNDKVPQSMQSVSLFTEVISLENMALQLGISHSTWNQTFTQIDSEVRDSTWAFDSPSDGTLFQVSRIITPLGVEFDTLEMRLSEEKWSQRYVELPITYLQKLIETKKKVKVSLGVAVIPGFSYSTYQGSTFTLGQRAIELFESSEPAARSLQISGQFEGRVSKQFSDHVNAFLTIGYRNNFTGLFSAASPVELQRGVVFASLGCHYFF